MSSALDPAMGAETGPIPDFSGIWGRDLLFFEPPSSGARPELSVKGCPWLLRTRANGCCREGPAYRRHLAQK